MATREVRDPGRFQGAAGRIVGIDKDDHAARRGLGLDLPAVDAHAVAIGAGVREDAGVLPERRLRDEYDLPGESLPQHRVDLRCPAESMHVLRFTEEKPCHLRVQDALARTVIVQQVRQAVAQLG